jgi:S-formylglutathione hydrolase FrmB
VISTSAPAPIYDRRVERITLASAALGVEKSLYVYLPPDLAPGQRAPALFWLRGHEREWVNPHEDAARGGQNIIDVYERLRAAGSIDPLILVFPGTTSDDGRIPGMVANMRAPELAGGAPGIGSGRFGDYFFGELIPYVDARYPTLGGRRRGVHGFSLGGAAAIAAAAARPDLFASAGAYDGTFLYATERGRRVRAADGVVRNPLFDPLYGVPRDPRAVAQTSASNLILRGDAATLAQVTWMIGYGPERHEPWQANFYRGEHLVGCLAARGLANALPHARFDGGDHSWRTADAFAELALPIHSHALYQ